MAEKVIQYLVMTGCMDLVVVPLEEKDVQEAIGILKEAWNHSYETWEKGYYPREGHEFDMSQNTAENFQRLIDEQHGFFFVAKIDGIIAGGIRGHIYGDSGYGMIGNIAVHPDYQRKGCGQALMEKALAHLSEKKCHKVSLHTFPVLVPAINLYLKMGFVPEAYMAKQWWGCDFIFMSKWLDK